MANSRLDTHAIVRPEEVGPLIVEPVESASVAIGVSTLAPITGEEFRIPVVTDDPAAAWVPEGGEIVADDLGSHELTVAPPKVAGATIISRELADDTTPAAADVVGQGLARDIARRVDQAFFGNTITNGPNGLESLAEVGRVNAGKKFANLDWAAEAMAAAETHGVNLATATFTAHPDDALSLAQLKTETGSNEPLLGREATEATTRRILGVPLIVSPFMSRGTVWLIPKEFVFVIRRTDVTLSTSEDVRFMYDQIVIRATMRIGFGFPHPAAIVKTTLAA